MASRLSKMGLDQIANGCEKILKKGVDRTDLTCYSVHVVRADLTAAGMHPRHDAMKGR